MANLEIERKFLLKSLPKIEPKDSIKIEQLYLKKNGIWERLRSWESETTGKKKWIHTVKTSLGKGVNLEDEYTVTEAGYADDGYTTTIDNVKTSTTAGTIATGAGTTADNGDKNITVVNDKTTNSPTGIFLHVAPYIVLIGAAIASSLLFFRRKRVKDMDID